MSSGNKNMHAQQHLLSLMNQAIEWRLIEMGLCCGVFDTLQQPRALEDIAKAHHWQVAKTKHLLDGFVAMDIVECNASYFSMTNSYSALLSTTNECSMVASLTHLNAIKLASVEQLLELMADNVSDTSHQVPFDSPVFWQVAAANLKSFHASTSAELYADILQATPQWSQVKSMLDLGAGSSVLGQRLIRDNTQLHYHLFDLPPVVEAIKQQLDSHTQMTLWQGNYNEAPLPQAVDLVLSAMSLYYAVDLDAVLKRCLSCLSANGMMISIHEGLTAARTQPAYHVIGRLLPVLKGNDLSFERGKIAQSMLRVGFRHVSSEEISTPFGPLHIDIGYK